MAHRSLAVAQFTTNVDAPTARVFRMAVAARLSPPLSPPAHHRMVSRKDVIA
jgi:hypothetical protein